MDVKLCHKKTTRNSLKDRGKLMSRHFQQHNNFIKYTHNLYQEENIGRHNRDVSVGGFIKYRDCFI